ncbi:MAG: hypothetical protein RJA70_354 [Pseudomonadota bacterium]|jgi:hypothetical protein
MSFQRPPAQAATFLSLIVQPYPKTSHQDSERAVPDFVERSLAAYGCQVPALVDAVIALGGLERGVRHGRAACLAHAQIHLDGRTVRTCRRKSGSIRGACYR